MTSSSEMGTKTVNAEVKSIIMTVLQRCKKEKDCNGLFVPLDDCEERVSYYTAFPKTYINQLHSGDLSQDTYIFDVFVRIAILKYIKNCHLKELLCPTYNNIYVAVKSEFIQPPDLFTFQQNMNSSGFKYKKTKKGQHIMEDPKITFERFRYLKNVKKMRNKNIPIYYIDERYVDNTYTFKKPWMCKNPEQDTFTTSSSEQFIFFHAISKKGLQGGLFCYDVTENDFTKWVVDILLPSIQSPSLFVMDKSRLHGKLSGIAISRFHTKAKMLNWLNEKDIPCDPNMRKAELYDLINKCSKSNLQKEYGIDLILKAHGHHVLRLPINYHDLSPTTLLWKKISESLKYTRPPSVDPEHWLKTKIMQLIHDIPEDQWEFFEYTIKNMEDKIFELDTEIEDLIDKLDVDVTHTDAHVVL